MKKQKENSHEGITWSVMGKQNVQAEKVYCHLFQNFCGGRTVFLWLKRLILTSQSAFILWKYNKSSIYTEDEEEEDGDDEEMEDDGNAEEKVNMLRFLLLFCFVLFCPPFFFRFV